MIDYHIHTAFSADCDVPLPRMAQAACNAGLKEICFTEHIDFDLPGDIDFCLDIKAYKEGFGRAVNDFPALNMRFGIEAGLDIAAIERMEAIINAQEIDCVIGSQHLVYGKDPFYRDIWDMYTQRDIYEQYLRACAECAAACDYYDVYGHLGYIGKFCPYEDNLLRFSDHKDAIDEILKTLVAKGKGLEINTNGLIMTPDTMPERPIAARYRELGGEIVTIGSDAHHEATVGHAVKEALHMLKDIGFRYVCAFDRHKPRFIPIP